MRSRQILFSTPRRQHFVQVAYHVRDLDAAVARWHAAFGFGPFVVRRHVALEQVRYRGAPAHLDISAAHVQAGDVQIELITQHGDDPSTFRDMFGSSDDGMHHMALFPEDYDAMVAHYAALGCPVASDFFTAERRGASYVDARSIVGHMIEIYRVNDSLLQFYAMVAEAARDWDGQQLIIEA